MPLIKQSVFGGIKPKIDKRLLDGVTAQVANNCKIESGAMVPFRNMTLVASLPDASRLSVFPYNGSWLSWITDVDVVRGPLAEDQYSRIYYTGDGAPKVRAIISGNEVSYKLGIPKPTGRPTIAIETLENITWTTQWHYFYEEPDGTQVNRDAVAISVTTVIAGKSYSLATIPARGAATSKAKLILFFDAYSQSGTLMGRCYPDISYYVNQSDLRINGATVTSKQVTGSSSVAITLAFDASTSDEYTTNRSYVYTFVSSMGEEGPPSDASEIVTMDPTQQAVVTCPDTDFEAGIVPIVKKRIYRTVTSNTTTAYQFVTDINLAVSAFVDNLTDLDVGETIPSVGWLPPDENLSGLVSMPGGFFAAFKGKTVYFSEPNYPHAWPIKYGQSVDYDIVGLAVYENTLVVMTSGMPFLMTMVDPGSVSISKIPSNQPCVSKRGIVTVSGAVAYPSKDGIVVVQSGTAIVFSGGVFGKDDWLLYDPEHMIGAVYDGQIYYVSPAAGIVYPLIQDADKVVTFDARPTAMYSDLETDSLYMVIGTGLYQWEGATTSQTMTLKSRELSFPRPYAPTVARITASAYPVTLQMYSNDALVLSRTVTDNEAFRLPLMRKEKFWAYGATGSSSIYEFLMSDAMGDLG